jgi:hypothetical protein
MNSLAFMIAIIKANILALIKPLINSCFPRPAGKPNQPVRREVRFAEGAFCAETEVIETIDSSYRLLPGAGEDQTKNRKKWHLLP